MQNAAEVRDRRQLTLCVLGHVDHGKTALVRAMTGIETDRLAEERERGLSIVPGYAWFERNGVCVDLIDAPGHQAFIRAMIGAASGIDAALLVVAANEGVMPQTREHVAIAGLLGIAHGIVVVSKADLASDAELIECRESVRAFLQNTFLSEAPIVEVSAIKENGIDELKGLLADIESSRADDPDTPFYMPIDRSFTKSGFGRIATGTVHAGVVSSGDTLVLTPGGEQVSVRGVQVHGQSVMTARQGDRAALNLRGDSVEHVVRGAVLGQENALLDGKRLDVLIEPVEEFAEAIRNGASFRVLIGTAEAQAKLRLLESDAASDDRVLAQLRCDRALPARRGMRFVLRSNSPAQTVGGGTVIDAQAPRRRRFDKANNAGLLELAEADYDVALRRMVHEAGMHGIDAEELAGRLGMMLATLDSLTASSQDVVSAGGRLFSSGAIETLESEIVAALRDYHAEHPQHAGMRSADLTAKFAAHAADTLIQIVCDRLKAAATILASGDRWHLAEFDATGGLSEAQRRLVQRLEAVFEKAGVESPVISELIGRNAAARESLQYLLDNGRVVRLQTRDRNMLALHASAIEDVRARISEQFPYPAQFAVKDVRDLLGTTRKHVVPLLEHLDATGFSLRAGDMRRLKQ
jgi:selenocysteine-specific elongation factor